MALLLAVHTGVADRAPAWLNTLILAEKWHMYPEDLARRRGGLKWAARQAALDEAREKSRKMREKS